MERHEGNIEIQSELGKGTTFCLIFPVRTKPSAGEAERRTGAAVEPMRILCIDVSRCSANSSRNFLSTTGTKWKSAMAASPGWTNSGWPASAAGPFDLVITDLGMPYVDGRQVAKTLNIESPDTPVVMLTGWGAFMKEEGSVPTQVDGIISKPPRSRELRETLRRLRPQKIKKTR